MSKFAMTICEKVYMTDLEQVRLWSEVLREVMEAFPRKSMTPDLEIRVEDTVLILVPKCSVLHKPEICRDSKKSLQLQLSRTTSWDRVLELIRATFPDTQAEDLRVGAAECVLWLSPLQ